jgi:tubulin polyglutamylase TTLL11
MKTNRIPEMGELCDKKITGYYLNKFREYFPEDYKFFPRTFLIPEEIEEF